MSLKVAFWTMFVPVVRRAEVHFVAPVGAFDGLMRGMVAEVGVGLVVFVGEREGIRLLETGVDVFEVVDVDGSRELKVDVRAVLVLKEDVKLLEVDSNDVSVNVEVEIGLVKVGLDVETLVLAVEPTLLQDRFTRLLEVGCYLWVSLWTR